MIGKTDEFRVSAEERDYLLQLSLLDQSIAAVLRFNATNSGLGATVVLTRAEAELLRDRLTAQLAANGFDENYCATGHGRMLEELLDRFFVR